MNIYVSNLSFNVQDEDLREFFTEYGEVTSAKVITDKFTGKSRGFGFVEMPDTEAAQKAISELDNEVGEEDSHRIKLLCLCIPFFLQLFRYLCRQDIQQQVVRFLFFCSQRIVDH